MREEVPLGIQFSKGVRTSRIYDVNKI